MQVTLKGHAVQRVTQRLNGLISREDIYSKISEVKSQIVEGRNYIVIKKVEYCEVLDPAVKPDGVARGDILVIPLDVNFDKTLASIPTVMLRKSWSKSPEYQNMIY